MGNNSKKRHISSGRGVISSRFVIIATLLLSVCVILVFLFIFNIISIPDYILNVFSSDGRGGDDEEYGSCEISDIETSPQMNVVYEKYFENAYDVLMSLSESRIYRRVIRTIYSENNNTFVERATIIHNGDLFRVEYPEKILIYDGEKLYTNEPTYTLVKDGKFAIYDEVGLTTLSYIQENCSESDVFYKDPDNKKTITVVIRDEAMPLYNEYEVSVENGLVLTERSYFNDQVYRAIVTDKIEIIRPVGF